MSDTNISQGFNQESDNILEISEEAQYRTVDELFKQSKSNSAYFTFLIVASLIIVCGLLLNNATIIIGGMLVAPIMAPMFVFALGVAVGELGPIRSMSIILGKTFLIVILGSLILTFIFGAPENTYILFDNTMRSAVLYLIVAFASGVTATLAWIKKESTEVLPGIALAVSLIPPLSSVGMWLGFFDVELVRYYFLVFVFNFIGVIMGSIAVFTLLKFYKTEKRVQQNLDMAGKART